jgi:hypothetical protein
MVKPFSRELNIRVDSNPRLPIAPSVHAATHPAKAAFQQKRSSENKMSADR